MGAESAYPTRFIGREVELRRLKDLFASGARLVSLVGPPGMGKTRLARRYAEGLERAVFCDLSDAVTRDDVCVALVRALGAALPARLSSDELLAYGAEALAARGDAFVVLDNFEQLVAYGPATVGRWLRAAPRAQLLVTTRERTRLTGEAVFELGQLDLGAKGAKTSDAVRLFVDRAQAAGASLDGRDPAELREIVRLLDGIPLAIELAAARAAVLDPRELARWLDERFALLARSPRDSIGRQATLRAAIDWSWNLLSRVEQGALAACSVFRGGFSLDAARAVLAPTEHGVALDLVEALHAKSLLRVEPAERARRFGMYLSIREYASEKLAARPKDAARARDRHARYYLLAGEGWSDRMARTGDLEAQRLLALEQENLLAIARGAAPEVSARATLALDPLLRTQGPYDEHLALLDRAIEARAPALDGALHAARGEAYRRRGRFTEAAADLRRALAAGRRRRDALVEGRARASLGMVHHQSGQLAEAARESERALTLHRRSGDLRWELIALNTIGLVSFAEGRLEDAQRRFDDVLERARANHDAWAEGITCSFAGEVRQERGLFEEAGEHLRRSADCAERVSDWRSLGLALGYLAGLEHETGDTTRALVTYERALERLGWHSEGRYGGLFRARACAAAADADRLDDAIALEAAARPVLRALGDAALVRALELHTGHIDLCRARRALGRGDELAVRRLVAAAHTRPKPTDARDREDVRFASRLLARALQSFDAQLDAPTASALEIDADGSGFRLPRAARVGIERRRALGRLLIALGEHRLASPGVAVTVAELMTRGWPGERMTHQSGVARVRVSIATLRDLGLRSLLLTRGDGYLLDPRVPVRLESA